MSGFIKDHNWSLEAVPGVDLNQLKVTILIDPVLFIRHPDDISLELSEAADDIIGEVVNYIYDGRKRS